MNKSLVLVMCDVLVLSAMSLSTGGFEESNATGPELPVNVTNAPPTVVTVVTNVPPPVVITNVPPPVVITNVPPPVVITNVPPPVVITNAPPDLLTLLSSLSNQLGKAKGELEEWEEGYGSGRDKREELIRKCVYGLFVKLQGAKKGEIYYTPLIRIGTHFFVIAYMPRKNVSHLDLEQVQIMSTNNCNRIGTVDSVWGLSGLYDQDIILFKLNVPNEMPALSLGVSKSRLRDHYYWFRARGSDVEPAGIMKVGAESLWKEYKQIVAGDMLISERSAAVVKMATKKVSALKNEVNFEHISESDLVRLK